MIQTFGKECPHCHTDKSASRTRQYYLVGGAFGGAFLGIAVGYLLGGGVGVFFGALAGLAVGIPAGLIAATRVNQSL
jgi:hypothetical protein